LKLEPKGRGYVYQYQWIDRSPSRRLIIFLW
jgi:hypothetical protein